jgi:hypothetical protein
VGNAFNRSEWAANRNFFPDIGKLRLIDLTTHTRFDPNGTNGTKSRGFASADPLTSIRLEAKELALFLVFFAF